MVLLEVWRVELRPKVAAQLQLLMGRDLVLHVLNIGLVLDALVDDALNVIGPPLVQVDLVDEVPVDLNDCVNVHQMRLVQLDFHL